MPDSQRYSVKLYRIKNEEDIFSILNSVQFSIVFETRNPPVTLIENLQLKINIKRKKINTSFLLDH